MNTTLHLAVDAARQGILESLTRTSTLTSADWMKVAAALSHGQESGGVSFIFSSAHSSVKEDSEGSLPPSYAHQHSRLSVAKKFIKAGQTDPGPG